MEEEPEIVSPPVTYTPDNEPYLGRGALHLFDLTIVPCLTANAAVAAASHRTTALTALQKAACQIIPQGISIGLSIRELIRQGYLFSAFVLLRPLIERAATIFYLVRNPDCVTLWLDGWKPGNRPSLRRMLEAMSGYGADTAMAKEICEFFGHAVHGDSLSAQWNAVALDDGGSGYASGRILNRPDLCDVIAENAYPFLLILMAMMAATFPHEEAVVTAITTAVEQLIPGSSRPAAPAA